MKSKVIITIILLLSCILTLSTNAKQVHADSLKENIDSQLENLDLSQLEDFFNNLDNSGNHLPFNEYISNLLNGKYNLDYENFAKYIKSIIFENIKQFLPSVISVFIISVFVGIFRNLRSSFNYEGTGNIIVFVALISIILILSVNVLHIFKSAKNAIESIAKLTNIMSPIILTLMIASGGNVSATIYKPVVAILSGGIINIFNTFIIPLIAVLFSLSILSNLNESIKLEKLSEFLYSIIKWIVGFIITIYGIFITVQGISSATFDGISAKALKYTISNSIPLIGGFLRDGFDLVVAGSILIKNSVGVVSLMALFLIIISPVIYMGLFSLILKLLSGLTEPITDKRISSFCFSLSKCVTYMIIAILTVGFMLFILILMMLFSANAFI